MSEFMWIMSEGGPLICMEAALAPSWRGVFGLSLRSDEAPNDYERAGGVERYVETLPLQSGQALVFGEGPLDTSVWKAESGQVFLVRIFACDEGVDFDAIMRGVEQSLFDSPAEQLEISFATPDLVIFDSAERGLESAKDCLAFSLAAGRYRILTQRYDPSPEAWLILHRFDRIA
jgi:hypothetical protein